MAPVVPSKPTSAKGESTSFEEVLGQSTQTPAEGDPNQAFVLNLEGNMLPGQPTAPTLNGPVNERLLGMPVAEPTLIAPGAKQKSVLFDEEGVDSLTRRVVWNDFLRKMRDELGVTAEDVLSAFASLSEEELSQPPQQTVDKVVAALGLNDQQAGVAKTYFSELVTKTGSRSMGEEISTSQRQINLTLMSQREVSRRTLDRSLEQMNKSFFLTPIAKPAGIPSEMVKVGEPNRARTDIPFMVNTPIAASKSETVSSPEINTVDQLVRQFLTPQAPVVEVPAEGEAAVPTTPLAAETVSAGSIKSLLQDLSSSLEGEEDSEFTSDASFLGAVAPSEGKANTIGNTITNFQAELAKVNQEPIGVNDLVDKAQIMVHEGGGEMKVTLSPEGLGEVAMRVSVNEGKVQVQMITESDEAKRLIERQLGELKGQLNNNQLQVDTIKIDTASNLGKQLEQQYQDAQRQATHTAMEQFRQDTQGWRRSFFEQPSAKLYRGQAEAPRDVQAPTPSSRKNVNRRLDLVA